jgi:hypothetical protein
VEAWTEGGDQALRNAVCLERWLQERRVVVVCIFDSVEAGRCRALDYYVEASLGITR